MRLEYYFRETAAGLRRNGIVAFAAMSTAFIALFLFGLVAADRAGVQPGDRRVDGQRAGGGLPDRPRQARDDRPAPGPRCRRSRRRWGSIEYWDKAKHLRAVRQALRGPEGVPGGRGLRGGDPDLVPDQPGRPVAVRPDHGGAVPAIPNDTGNDRLHRSRGPERLGLPRACSIGSRRSRTCCSIGVLAIAVIMLAAAIALVANTLRMGMFARRKEIGIMRLVGATNWRIRVPFLIEGLVEALVGATLAIVRPVPVIKVLAIDRLRGAMQFFPLIKNSDVLWRGAVGPGSPRSSRSSPARSGCVASSTSEAGRPWLARRRSRGREDRRLQSQGSSRLRDPGDARGRHPAHRRRGEVAPRWPGVDQARRTRGSATARPGSKGCTSRRTSKGTPAPPARCDRASCCCTAVRSTGSLVQQQEERLSLVPMRVYFTHGLAKVEIGVGRGQARVREASVDREARVPARDRTADRPPGADFSRVGGRAVYSLGQLHMGVYWLRLGRFWLGEAGRDPGCHVKRRNKHKRRRQLRARCLIR